MPTASCFATADGFDGHAHLRRAACAWARTSAPACRRWCGRPRKTASPPLKAALNDPAVHTLVLALRLGEPPVAVLAACLTAPDALAQWQDLSCI
jgi:hypothetical protein